MYAVNGLLLDNIEDAKVIAQAWYEHNDSIVAVEAVNR